MNTLVVRPHGHSPYRLVYKAEPAFSEYLERLEAPLGQLWGQNEDVSLEDEAAMLEELSVRWRVMLPEIKRRLALSDKHMEREYKRR